MVIVMMTLTLRNVIGMEEIVVETNTKMRIHFTVQFVHVMKILKQQQQQLLQQHLQLLQLQLQPIKHQLDQYQVQNFAQVICLFIGIWILSKYDQILM